MARGLASKPWLLIVMLLLSAVRLLVSLLPLMHIMMPAAVAGTAAATAFRHHRRWLLQLPLRVSKPTSLPASLRLLLMSSATQTIERLAL
jgi:hypothetical protein